MKIPAILVTFFLAWGLANGGIVESSAAASAQASASSSVGKSGLHRRSYPHFLKEDKQHVGLLETSLNEPALKIKVINGGIDSAKGAADLEAAIIDPTTMADQRSLFDFALGTVANSAELLSKAQAAQSAQAGANANDAVARAIALLEIADKAQYTSAIFSTKASKAAEAAMASAARATAAASAAKASSQESVQAASSAANTETKANAASIIANQQNAVMAESAAVLAAAAAKSKESAIKAQYEARAAAKTQSEITQLAAEALILLAKAKAAIARAAADQAVCTSQAQAASQIQSRASASESAASAQSETNTAAAEAVALADAEAAAQAKEWEKSLKHDMWLRLNLKGDAKAEAAAVTIDKGYHGFKKIGSVSEASSSASSDVKMSGRHDYVSEALADTSAGSSA